MAKMSAKGCVIQVKDSGGTLRDISADCDSYEIQTDIDSPEITGFTEGSHNFTPGLKVSGVTLDIFWNSAATTGSFTVLNSILGASTSKTVSIKPDSGGLTFSGEFMLTGIKPAGKPNDVIKLGTCKFVVMGAVAPGWA